MNVQRIGGAAGAVWARLHEVEVGGTVSMLKRIDGFTGDEIVAGIGWLAREGKIDFQTVNKKTCVCLVEAELYA